MSPQQTLSNIYINDNINGFEAITPNHILIVYQNDENWFANPTLYIKGLENHFKTVQSCTNIVLELLEKSLFTNTN